MSAGTLIVGAGQAGLQIATTLRERGYEELITIVGDEAYMPYSRPPLSKALLSGDDTPLDLALRTDEYYGDQVIDVIPGLEIVRIEHDGTGGQAIGANGRVLKFDRLALATGATPRRLNVPGAQLEGVCYLRALDDAHYLRKQLNDSENVVVIGGGFIGLEVASAARKAGRNVVVLEALDRLIARSAAPLVSDYFRGLHVRNGVDVRLGASVSSLLGEAGRVSHVELEDGTRIPADLVVVGVGVDSNIALARQLGLECDGGIVVDRFARTSNLAIVAAGDCTVLPNPLTGEGRYRLESTQNAASQGKTAAMSILGQLSPQNSAPWFWSDQYDVKLQIAGLIDGYDDFVLRGDPSSDSFSVLYYRGASLLGATSVNQAAEYLAARTALDRGFTIDLDAARDASTPLKELLTPQQRTPCIA